MKWLIRKADFLGIKPILNINKQSRSKNLFSGGISIITCVVITALTIYFLINLISRSESSMVFNSLPSFDLNQNISDFPYLIGLVASTNGKYFGDDFLP